MAGEDHLKRGLIADDGGVPVDADIDGSGLPSDIVDASARDGHEVVVPGQNRADGGDELEVLRVQIGRCGDITRNQRAEPGPLDRADLFRDRGDGGDVDCLCHGASLLVPRAGMY
jgi:hypothetical protein